MEDMEIITMYFGRQGNAIQETENKYGVYLNTVAYHILRSFDDTEEGKFKIFFIPYYQKSFF